MNMSTDNRMNECVNRFCGGCCIHSSSLSAFEQQQCYTHTYLLLNTIFNLNDFQVPDYSFHTAVWTEPQVLIFCAMSLSLV